MTDREAIAEALWRAESFRVMGTDRSVPWSEAGPAAQQQWRYLAAAIAPVIRAEVLEEAAKVAEFSTAREYTGKPLAQEIAAAIRAIKAA